jgi:hypothetical protein
MLTALIMTVLATNFSRAIAQESAFNSDDPKYQSEVARMSNPQVMNAQFLSRGIPCETGACFKDADPSLGLDETPEIHPDGTVVKRGQRAKPGDIVQ